MLKESAHLVILGVLFDSKITFEEHLRTVSSAADQRLCIMRKSWLVFHDQSLLLQSFLSFVLSRAVWCSAADSHLKLSDRVVRVLFFYLVLFWSAILPSADLEQCCAGYLR